MRKLRFQPLNHQSINSTKIFGMRKNKLVDPNSFEFKFRIISKLTETTTSTINVISPSHLFKIIKLSQ